MPLIEVTGLKETTTQLKRIADMLAVILQQSPYNYNETPSVADTSGEKADVIYSDPEEQYVDELVAQYKGEVPE